MPTLLAKVCFMQHNISKHVFRERPRFYENYGSIPHSHTLFTTKSRIKRSPRRRYSLGRHFIRLSADLQSLQGGGGAGVIYSRLPIRRNTSRRHSALGQFSHRLGSPTQTDYRRPPSFTIVNVAIRSGIHAELMITHQQKPSTTSVVAWISSLKASLAPP